MATADSGKEKLSFNRMKLPRLKEGQQSTASGWVVREKVPRKAGQMANYSREGQSLIIVHDYI